MANRKQKKSLQKPLVEDLKAHPAAAAPVQAHPSASPTKWRTFLCYLLVFIVALFCFVARLAQPPYLFWDENYHVTSAERYIEGIAQFEPHPPLGLMLIAAGEALVKPNQTIDKRVLTTTKQIRGEDLPQNFSFAGMRLMPSLFAALGGLLFFGLMYELLQNRLHALLFTSLYLFENAFVVHFRAVHLDSFQMFFSLAALWQFVYLWRTQENLHWRHYALLGGWCGFAMMAKINAVLLLILLPILYFKDLRRLDNNALKNLSLDFLRKSTAATGAILIIIFVTFYVHAAIARTPPSVDTQAGRQDLENMSVAYRQFLDKHEDLTPSMVATIARDYFKFMNKDHRGVPKLDVTKPGENGSHPLHWLVHEKTINYRWDSADGKTSYVQLTGNQVSWFLGLVALILSFQLISSHRVFGTPIKGSQKTYYLIEVFAGLYATFMLLHLWIIAQRVMYLYHYFLGLVISYVLIALMWQYLCDIRPGLARNKTSILTIGAAGIFLSFLFFLPLSNHQPLTFQQCEARNVFERVVECVQ